MKVNMGPLDRMIRGSIAAIAILLYYSGTLTGVWGSIALVLSVVFFATSVFRYCPIYALFGMSTCSVRKHPK